MGYPHQDYHAVVLGGGPAGCATALALQRRGVERILVVEAGSYEKTSIGESIPPDTRLLLEQLGIWEDFLLEKHEPCLGSCASWGDAELGYNDFLFNPFGNGWHLDRRRFDRFLARKVVESGATLCTKTRFSDCERIAGEGFRLYFIREGGETSAVRARFVVDATGVRSVLARHMGAQRLFLDRLVCVYGFFELPASTHNARGGRVWVVVRGPATGRPFGSRSRERSRIHQECGPRPQR